MTAAPIGHEWHVSCFSQGMVCAEQPGIEPATLRVLVGDDNPAVCEAVRLALKGVGHTTGFAYAPREIAAEAASGRYDVLLLDMNYTRDTTSGREGLQLLDRIHRLDPDLPVVVMTAWGSIDLAVEAMRRGAVDFVTKPWDNAALVAAIAKHAGTARRRASELDIAARVQRNLFPARVPPLATLDCVGACIPAQRVGGDYYDVFDIASGERAFVVADVCGKGIGAALLMANLQALFRGQIALLEQGTAALLRPVNRLFHDSTAPEHFATAFVARYNEHTRTLRYVNCGHPAALLARSCGRVERLQSTATLLGMFAQWDCEEAEVCLNAGDALVAYSDGVLEAENARGEEFGEERAATLLSACRHRSASEIGRALIDAVQVYAGGVPDDDVTVVAARAL